MCLWDHSNPSARYQHIHFFEHETVLRSPLAPIVSVIVIFDHPTTAYGLLKYHLKSSQHPNSVPKRYNWPILYDISMPYTWIIFVCMNTISPYGKHFRRIFTFLNTQIYSTNSHIERDDLDHFYRHLHEKGQKCINESSIDNTQGRFLLNY